MIRFQVNGEPIPQGSMQSFGKGRMVYRPDLKPWRLKVRSEYVRQAGSQTVEGAVRLGAEFVLPRPDGHYGTGRNAGVIKPSYVDAPCAVTPDLDKCVRAIGDGLSLNKGNLEGLPRPFRDDAQITELTARKRYVHQDETPHAVITISPAYS